METLSLLEAPQSQLKSQNVGRATTSEANHSSNDLDNDLAAMASGAGEASPAPVLLFEWELGPEERAASASCASHDAEDGNSDAPSPLRWFGSFEAHLGYESGDWPHTLEAWCQALHPADCARVIDAIQTHLQSGAAFFETARARRHDGSWLRFTFSGVATRDARDHPWKFTGTLCDFVVLDENGVAPSPAHEQQEARARSLLRTASHLNAQLDLQDVCDAICEEAGRTIGAPSAVMLFNKTLDAFVPTAVRDMPRDYDKRYIPTMRSIYDGHVREMGPLFLFTDAQATPDLPNHQLYLEVDMRTIGIASLIREGEVLGLLKVYSFGQPRTFDENELALLQGLADQGAQAISNARFYAESQRRLANIQSLRQIDMAILGSSEINVALGVVLDQMLSQLGVDAASVLLLNEHTRTLRYAGGRGFRTATPRRTDWQIGEGLAGRAARERCTIHVPDLSRPEVVAVASTDPELKLPGVAPPHDSGSNGTAPDDSLCGGAKGSCSRRTGVLPNEGFASYYAVPLIAAGQVRGVLEAWHRSSLRLDEEKLEFLETLAGQAAIAVDNANLFRDVQRSNDELMLAYDSTLEGWSGALDLRDKETEGHTQRVTSETLRLAAHMGLNDAQLLQMRRGALLHDIGKMGIPDAILLKPGPLSPEEWLVMRKHPTYALELLSSTEYLRPALEIPYCHHEKWDGSGYPRGLKGQEIPLAARIFAVVDVWDALCSDRPYRQGWPIARVLRHIRDEAGRHFDPQVVAAFLDLHSDVCLDETGLDEPEAPAPVAPLPVIAIGAAPRRGFWARLRKRWSRRASASP